MVQIDGTRLLGRDINVRCTTKVNARNMLLQIKQLLLTNNTSGANLYDLVRGLQIPTVTEMNSYMQQLEQRAQQEKQAEQQAEQQQAQAEQQHTEQLKQEQWQHEDAQNDKKYQTEVYIAEIQAASRAAQATTPDAGEEAYQKGLDRVTAQSQFQEQMNLDREKHITGTRLEEQKIQMRQKEVQAEDKETREMAMDKKIQAKVKEKNDKAKKK